MESSGKPNLSSRSKSKRLHVTECFPLKMVGLRWGVKNKTVRIKFKVWFIHLSHDHLKYPYLARACKKSVINDGLQNNKFCFMKIKNVADFPWQSPFLRQRIQILNTYLLVCGISQFGSIASGLVFQLERKHSNFHIRVYLTPDLF